MNPKEISLVLSGGGARGIAHIGVINYLEKNGYKIKNIGGTSMGSIVGGVYAQGNLKPFTEYLLNLDAKRIIQLLDFSMSRPGLIKAEKILRELRKFLPIELIEDTPIPYYCVATDLNQRNEVVWKKGNMLTAIHSSFAIPFIFTPVMLEDKILVDGGVVNNIPINHIDRDLLTIAVCANAGIPMDEKLQEINKASIKKYKIQKNSINKYLSKVLNIFSDEDKKSKKMPGYYDILDKTLHIMIENNSKNIIKRYPPDILVNLPREIAGTFDFLKAETLIKAGEYIAEKAIKEYYE